MLTRAARRRHALRCVEHAADGLYLPWLCPALNRSLSPVVQRRNTSTRPALPSPRSLVRQSSPSRRLASATSIAEDFDPNDDYLPFTYERHVTPEPRPRSEPMPTFDLSDLLKIDQTTIPHPIRSLSKRSADHRGHASEVEATLEACLQVQRWNRAFHILRQLSGMFIGNTAKLQQIYNRVLEAMVFDLIWSRNTENQDKINKWIEVHMRRAGVEPDAQTFALKIKVALATLSGSRQMRTVTRYWEMAKEYQFENQVASLRNILSDQDLGKLTEICPLEIELDLNAESGGDSRRDDTTLTEASPTANSGSVREAEQKGLGLISLRQALASFKDNGSEAQVSHQDVLEPQWRQLKLEQDSLQSAVSRWKIEHEKRMKLGVAGNVQHGKLGALTWQWHESLMKKIQRELALVEQAEESQKQTAEDRLRCEYGPFLRLLSIQNLAALTTISVVRIMNKVGIASSVKVARIVTELGRAVEEEVEAYNKRAKQSIKKTKTGKSAENEGSDGSVDAQPSLHQSTFGPAVHWTAAIHAKIGAILCELLFDVAKIPVRKEDSNTKKAITIAEPVFRRQTVYVHGRRVGTISLHPAYSDMLTKQPPADLIAKQLPMIAKPQQWKAFSEGGYLETAQPVLRVKHQDVAQRDYAKAAAERGDLDQVFAGLDVLGKTGWKVNRKVFNVMLEAWNSGKAVANLPPLDKVFPTVDKPAENASPMEKWNYYQKLRAIENEKSGLHSNRCFQNFQMEIARSYLDETFYLPHNVDFRGRAYPIPPYLNQMGADNARGLLVFANGRALGSDGLRWLQIHLANVFGYDKASLSDRAQFALDHIDDVRDSVKDPLNGKGWWLKAEDPWQCLATCYEFVAALDSNDPEAYISHLPIHQDGTCNGLQHYAALGGDLAGARQVNLEPGDKPADVYTGVAELVRAEIKQDAEGGLEIAKMLDGRITRKIVKQTVMTNVYGVTFTGAIRQVRKQVDDILSDINEGGHGGQAAVYITRKIFRGLGTLFEGAHEIQYWLGDCANRITHSISPAQIEQIERKALGELQRSDMKNSVAKKRGKKTDNMIDASDFRSTVIWTTPLRLPVVQPYKTSRAEVVHTSTQGLSLTQPSVADAVDPRKQLQAFPPNFVHSLDATHMMLSALKANELGLTFSAVHDSFWTHAADINTLNIVLRDQFIRMHSENIIGRLAAEFRARYKGHWYLAKISRDNELSRELRTYRSNLPGSKSDIRSQKHAELVREIKRMRLMASDNAAERAAGEKMVTAFSLFEKHRGERYLPEKVSLGQTAVGEVPEADPLAVAEALNANSGRDVDLENTLEPLQEDVEPGNTRPSKHSSTQHDWLWLPLTFKNIPKKGDFSVERLRDSTYFFS